MFEKQRIVEYSMITSLAATLVHCDSATLADGEVVTFPSASEIAINPLFTVRPSHLFVSNMVAKTQDIPQRSVAEILHKRLLSQQKGTTHSYLVVGYGVDSRLVETLLHSFCGRDVWMQTCHLFSMDESELVCDTFHREDFTANPAVSSSTFLGLSPSVSYLSLHFSEERQAVVILQKRITIAMMALHQASSLRDTIICTGPDMTSQVITQLILEYNGLTELVDGPSRYDDKDVLLDEILHGPSSKGLAQPSKGLSIGTIQFDATGASATSSAVAREQDEAERELLENQIHVLEQLTDHLREQLAEAREQVQRVTLQHTAAAATIAELDQQQRQLSELREAVSAAADDKRLVETQLENARWDLDQEREQNGRERAMMEAEMNVLQHQLETADRQNAELRAVVSASEKEHDLYTTERGMLHRNIEALESRLVTLAETLEDWQQTSRDREQMVRKELLESVMDFQRREKMWQDELRGTTGVLDATNRRVEELQRIVDRQSHTMDVAAQAASMSHELQTRELDQLLAQVKALSPFGRVPPSLRIPSPSPGSRSTSAVAQGASPQRTGSLVPHVYDGNLSSNQRTHSSPFRSSLAFDRQALKNSLVSPIPTRD